MTVALGRLKGNQPNMAFQGYNKNGDASETKSTSAMSLSSSYNIAKSPLARSTRVTRIVWTGRLCFMTVLAVVAASVGIMAYFITHDFEMTMSESLFDAAAERATAVALETILRQRSGIILLASILSGANPDSSRWPNATLNNFETISRNLKETSRGSDILFAPLVSPDQVPEFQDFALSYYRQRRLPDPFSAEDFLENGGVVFSVSSSGTADRMDTSSTNSTTIVAPVLHDSTGQSEYLLLDLYSDPIIGSMMDDIIRCAEEQEPNADSLESCTVLSEFSPDTINWFSNSNEPWLIMMAPVAAQDSPSTVSGVIVTTLLASDIYRQSFTDLVTGVHAVLMGGSDQAFTYIVREGNAEPMGNGDLHSSEFNDVGQEVTLTPSQLFGPQSIPYTLSLYPTDAFFESYSTANPMIASIGFVLVLIVTAVMFVLYDRVIRRDYYVKRDLLEAKRKFVRFVSHEVRTPLSSMSMGLSVLRSELDTRFGNQNNPKCKGSDLIVLADEVAVNCHSAVDVLNDFLNYDKIETNSLTLDLSVVRLFDLVEETAGEFKLVAANNKIRLVVETPVGKGETGPHAACFTIGDAMRITQVLRNLVSNAIEFTPEGGTVEVKAAWLQASLKGKKNYKNFELKDGDKLKVAHNGFLRLTVSDNGKGMSDLQIRNILTKGPKFNVNGLEAGDGSGLGLWVAKGIVNRHGGTLTAVSAGLGEGSCFTVSLPSYDVARAKGAKLPRESTEDAGEYLGILKVLVVDDAKMNLKLLMRLVSKRGHKVEGAEDGEIAVRKASAAMLEGADYDVILMDYQMPNMDGPTATRVLREQGCDAVIIGVTGNVMAEDVAHFKKCGANAVVHKPAKIETLEDIMIQFGARGACSTFFEAELHEHVSPTSAQSSTASESRETKRVSSRVDMTGDIIDSDRYLHPGEIQVAHLEEAHLEETDGDDWISRRTTTTDDASLACLAEGQVSTDIWKSNRSSVGSEVVET
eukprot:scaffold7133_cov116-Cylindrotheca_fusiformis.AAC.6